MALAFLQKPIFGKLFAQTIQHQRQHHQAIIDFPVWFRDSQVP